MFQWFLGTEFVILAFAARYRNVSLSVFKRLDEKCGVDEKYISKLEREVERQTFLCVISILIDIIGMYILETKIIDMFTYLIMFSAHEAETIFFALIIEDINFKLNKLHDSTPSAGSRVYRHVLIASSQMNEEFTPRVSAIEHL